MGSLEIINLFKMFKASTLRNMGRSVASKNNTMTPMAVRAFSAGNQPEGGMNYGMFAGAAVLASGAAYMMAEKKEVASVAAAADSYPPHDLSPNVKTLPGWIQAGCGNDEYICSVKGATFSCKEPLPQALPDLTNHANLCTDALKADLGIYDRLRTRKTSLGVNLGHCIKTGIDNKGHPMITTCGIVAGDEESWTVFAELMDKVVSARHGGYSPYAMHPSDMNPANISNTKIDPTGKYIITARCRTGRSVRGFRLPPCNSFEERREIERLVVEGLLNMTGELKGEYFPLCGSRSYPAKPNGMTEAKEEQLRSRGNLFQEPDSTLLLSSGCGRHWPDARGIFHNENMDFFVWINEEDHMRIISMGRATTSRPSSTDSPTPPPPSRTSSRLTDTTSCTTSISVSSSPAPPTSELVSEPAPWSSSPTSPLEKTSSRSAPSSPSRPVVAPKSTPLPSVALGTSPTPTV